MAKRPKVGAPHPPEFKLDFEEAPHHPGDGPTGRYPVMLPTESAIIVARDLLRYEHRDSKDPIPEGVFQPNVLSTAVERSRMGPFPPYTKVDIFLRTAFLVRGIVGEHAFANGCKRTGLVVLGITLLLNGYTLRASQDAAVKFMMGVADGRITDPLEMAEWIRRRVRRTHPHAMAYVR